MQDIYPQYGRTDLKPQAEKAFSQFVRTIKSLREKDWAFDILAGAGDSGASAIKFTQITLSLLGKRELPAISFPLYRERNEQGETASVKIECYLGEARDFLKDKSVRNVLFVDDEIGKGGAARGVIDLIKFGRVPSPVELFITIVAENHGYTSPSIEGAKIHFAPFASGTKGIYALLSRLINPADEERIRHVIAPKETKAILWKQATNILLNVPIKKWSGTRGVWTYEYHDRAKTALPELPAMQKRFKREIEDLATTALSDSTIVSESGIRCIDSSESVSH